MEKRIGPYAEIQIGGNGHAVVEFGGWLTSFSGGAHYSGRNKTLAQRDAWMASSASAREIETRRCMD
jgi:hypothetical protein